MSAVGQRILAALFLILTGRFVDDLFSADAGEKIAGLRWSGAEGAAALTRAVIEDLLGWQLDETKRTSAAAAAPVLGVAVAMQCGEERPEAPSGGAPAHIARRRTAPVLTRRSNLWSSRLRKSEQRNG